MSPGGLVGFLQESWWVLVSPGGLLGFFQDSVGECKIQTPGPTGCKQWLLLTQPRQWPRDIHVHQWLEVLAPNTHDNCSCFLYSKQQLPSIWPKTLVNNVTDAFTGSVLICWKAAEMPTPISFLAKLTTVGISQNQTWHLSLPARQLTYSRPEHGYVPDSVVIKTQVLDPPFIDPQQCQIPEQQDMLNEIPVCRDERSLKLTVALQRWFMAVLIGISRCLQPHAVESQLCSSHIPYGITDLLDSSTKD